MWEMQLCNCMIINFEDRLRSLYRLAMQASMGYIPMVTKLNPGTVRAIVIFDTRYGNTEKVAKSLEAGLKKANIETVCVNAKDVSLDLLSQYHLICIGAPTEMRTASQPMKKLLDSLENEHIAGKFGFAFDTQLPSSLSGSASKFIEKRLKHLGLDIVFPHCSAIVVRQKGTLGNVKLQEGEEKRFEDLGRQVGVALFAKGKIILA
jgi:flavodoxin